jgi:hypothetical protein
MASRRTEPSRSLREILEKDGRGKLKQKRGTTIRMRPKQPKR